MIAPLAELPLAAEPGTVYQYSVADDVMGLIIERVSGKSLEAYFRQRIFEPLKMTSSGFQVPASQASRLTTNYEVAAGRRVRRRLRCRDPNHEGHSPRVFGAG